MKKRKKHLLFLHSKIEIGSHAFKSGNALSMFHMKLNSGTVARNGVYAHKYTI